ncbi:helix-hairpin-helix domain-containing protein [Marinomonas rhizomae]|uniref:Competence protein ComEA n=1 Tax=Marinomonas rhizomae TaxID=491948 RepID=A0A366J9C2_9GAMM|nr:helix-hairpin-helix domain-containing protein [Marinomonas rhizomae]RBP83543.1 competence protein ComEA [Marinomonas rhizomae]RNF74172.1 helix-hairpin-helix domain-containing protein [Marinomonas rhizomae]
MTNFNRIVRVCVSRSLLIVSLAFMPLSLFAATPLDINTATAAQFAAVMSGVGAKKAEAIIAYREAYGRFESIDQLSQVKGIGDALLARNKDLLRVVGSDDSLEE